MSGQAEGGRPQPSGEAQYAAGPRTKPRSIADLAVLLLCSACLASFPHLLRSRETGYASKGGVKVNSCFEQDCSKVQAAAASAAGRSKGAHPGPRWPWRCQSNSISAPPTIRLPRSAISMAHLGLEKGIILSRSGSRCPIRPASRQPNTGLEARTHRWGIAALSLDVNQIPGDMGWPLIGETLAFINDNDFHTTRKAKHGPIYRTNYLGRNTVAIEEAAEVRKLLSSDGKVMEVDWPAGVKEMLGPNAIGVSNGPKHDRARGIVNQAFTRQAVHGYVPSIAAIFRRRLAAWPEKDPLRLFVAVKDVVFETAARVLLGFDLSDELLEHCSSLSSDVAAATFSVPLRLNPVYRKGQDSRRELLEITEKLINDMPAELPGTVREGATALQLLKGAKNEEGHSLSMDDLLDLTVNIYFAATETTSFTLTSMITQLAKRPDVMQRLQQEQQELMRKHGSDITGEMLEGMPYATSVIRESLRFRPAVPGVMRRAKEDLQVGDYNVPKGWYLYLVLPFSRLESEHFADQSLDFQPERWLDADGALIKEPRLFIPFSEGARACVGWRLAMDESKIMCALLARHCTWEQLNPGHQLEAPLDRNNDDMVKMRFTFSEKPLC